MEISSSSNIYSSVSSSQTTATNKNSNSFDTLLNTQIKDNTNESSVTTKTSRIINFLEKHNRLNSLSTTDEKIFRELLSDDKLTKEEADSLTYEQIEQITNLVYPNNMSEEELNSMPIVQVYVDLFATTTTGNRDFNKAFYNTLKEIDSPLDANKLKGEVENNLGQLFLGRELKATFEYTGSYLANPWEYEKMDADFGKFIQDVKERHQGLINNPKVHPEAKKQFQDIVNLYNILEKNYNEVKNKPKYA